MGRILNVPPYETFTAEEELCDARIRPHDEQECGVDDCAHWHVTEWSSCSESCGSGVRTRYVYCVYG